MAKLQSLDRMREYLSSNYEPLNNIPGFMSVEAEEAFSAALRIFCDRTLTVDEALEEMDRIRSRLSPRAQSELVYYNEEIAECVERALGY